ncbi:hypothetical protein DX914_07295 [Lysobacter silvisoli]|uniref:3'-kinase n=2 Tax=Lysobacter silvisoli TaxID=2293254 RepID=A0A371K753_9GAMM|nr:hypothetical protein DX914_07295 [Lysobacter silvisoli]
MTPAPDASENAARPDPDTALAPWRARWSLQPDGAAFDTPSSALQPVRHAGQPAMLKLAYDAEEQRSGVLMRWWDGDGAARVLACEGPVLLLERATGGDTLLAMAGDGRDAQACRILCDVAQRLHGHPHAPPQGLVPLPRYFDSLEQAARDHGGLYATAWSIAHELLSQPWPPVPLHGDLHHENVLDFGPQRGWLAIDPKRVIGERGYDYATQLGDPLQLGDELPGRLAGRLDIVTEAGGIPRSRMLRWVVAQQGLSAAWHLEDDEEDEAELPLSVLRAALVLGAGEGSD